MPLSPEQEWTLCACALVAHADGILEVDEWDQVLWMIDERLDLDEAKSWSDLLSDQAKAQAHLDGLQPPPPFLAESILEKAWRMALSDGRGSDEEVVVHDRIAAKLGVDAAEAAKHREDWSARAATRGELIAGFAAYLATLDGRCDPGEINEYEELLGRLPLSDERRTALRGKLDDPPSVDEIAGGLTALEHQDREIALFGLAPIIRAAARGERERKAFLDLAQRVAISREDAEKILDR